MLRLRLPRACGASSDLEIMIEVDAAARLTVFDCVGLKESIASLFDGPVDVVNGDSLKPHVGPAATADAHYAFSIGAGSVARHPASHRHRQ